MHEITWHWALDYGIISELCLWSTRRIRVNDEVKTPVKRGFRYNWSPWGWGCFTNNTQAAQLLFPPLTYWPKFRPITTKIHSLPHAVFLSGIAYQSSELKWCGGWSLGFHSKLSNDENRSQYLDGLPWKNSRQLTPITTPPGCVVCICEIDSQHSPSVGTTRNTKISPVWGRTGMALPVLSAVAAEKVSGPTGGPAVISGRYTNVTHYSYSNIPHKNSATATLTLARTITTMWRKK